MLALIGAGERADDRLEKQRRQAALLAEQIAERERLRAESEAEDDKHKLRRNNQKVAPGSLVDIEAEWAAWEQRQGSKGGRGHHRGGSHGPSLQQPEQPEQPVTASREKPPVLGGRSPKNTVKSPNSGGGSNPPGSPHSLLRGSRPPRPGAAEDAHHMRQESSNQFENLRKPARHRQEQDASFSHHQPSSQLAALVSPRCQWPSSPSTSSPFAGSPEAAGSPWSHRADDEHSWSYRHPDAIEGHRQQPDRRYREASPRLLQDFPIDRMRHADFNLAMGLLPGAQQLQLQQQQLQLQKEQQQQLKELQLQQEQLRLQLQQHEKQLLSPPQPWQQQQQQQQQQYQQEQQQQYKHNYHQQYHQQYQQIQQRAQQRHSHHHELSPQQLPQSWREESAFLPVEAPAGHYRAPSPHDFKLAAPPRTASLPPPNRDEMAGAGPLPVRPSGGLASPRVQLQGAGAGPHSRAGSEGRRTLANAGALALNSPRHPSPSAMSVQHFPAAPTVASRTPRQQPPPLPPSRGALEDGERERRKVKDATKEKAKEKDMEKDKEEEKEEEKERSRPLLPSQPSQPPPHQRAPRGAKDKQVHLQRQQQQQQEHQPQHQQQEQDQHQEHLKARFGSPELGSTKELEKQVQEQLVDTRDADDRLEQLIDEVAADVGVLDNSGTESFVAEEVLEVTLPSTKDDLPSDLQEQWGGSLGASFAWGGTGGGTGGGGTGGGTGGGPSRSATLAAAAAAAAAAARATGRSSRAESESAGPGFPLYEPEFADEIDDRMSQASSAACVEEAGHREALDATARAERAERASLEALADATQLEESIPWQRKLRLLMAAGAVAGDDLVLS